MNINLKEIIMSVSDELSLEVTVGPKIAAAGFSGIFLGTPYVEKTFEPGKWPNRNHEVFDLGPQMQLRILSAGIPMHGQYTLTCKCTNEQYGQLKAQGWEEITDGVLLERYRKWFPRAYK
ncbi:MAG: hypothetical protein NUV88_02325 [Candidatus Kaiserbacteria bacterium]|nr:hypothetical protein [Candidatus Kaiserbacteria bacterium]